MGYFWFTGREEIKRNETGRTDGRTKWRVNCWYRRLPTLCPLRRHSFASPLSRWDVDAREEFLSSRYLQYNHYLQMITSHNLLQRRYKFSIRDMTQIWHRGWKIASFAFFCVWLKLTKVSKNCILHDVVHGFLARRFLRSKCHTVLRYTCKRNLVYVYKKNMVPPSADFHENHKSSIYLLYPISPQGGTRWRSWLRHRATSRKVSGSILDVVFGIFHWYHPIRLHYGPGVDSASNMNKYQEYFLGVKAAGA